ncbi:MAG: flagellar motor switch protein FliN [Deltaproteobacteria bacterium]|nr:flagellar motor switch protein FliN [Deltaproteobacteria bacterium]MBW2078702.1 flagellar motor switch protein FliN [Deltaproteobacteria bacterium]
MAEKKNDSENTRDKPEVQSVSSGVSSRNSDPPARDGNTEQGPARGIDFLLDVPLQVSVEVGRARMLIKDFLQMKEGGVIELDKMADEPLDLYVNSRFIARGEAVVVNEKFGLRLIDVVSPAERIEKLR